MQQLGFHLQQGVMQATQLGEIIGDLKLQYDGYRALWGGPSSEKANLYLAVLKTGVVHYATHTAFRESENKEFWDFFPLPALNRMIEGLMVSHEVLRMSSYHGPVRLLYELRPEKRWRLDPRILDHKFIEVGVFTSQVDDVNLERSMGSWGVILKEMLDPIFHAAGKIECSSIFTPDGILKKHLAQLFRQYGKYVQIEP
jgi:hypothetical protein